MNTRSEAPRTCPQAGRAGLPGKVVFFDRVPRDPTLKDGAFGARAGKTAKMEKGEVPKDEILESLPRNPSQRNPP